MKLSIKNFQSVREANLDIPTGLTVIVGPTNSGKTALYRALDTMLSPESLHTHFITTGQEEVSVGIEDGNHSLVMTRGVSSSKKFSLDGSLVPISEAKESVRNTFGLKSLQVGQQSFDVNFWRQMEPPFLSNVGAQSLFDFFSQASKQDRIQESAKKLQKDIKAISTELTQAEGVIDYQKGELQELESRQKAYYRYKEAYEILEKGSKLRSRLATSYGIIERLGQLQKEFTDVNETYTLYIQVTEKARGLVSQGEGVIAEYNTLVGLLTKIQKVATQINQLQAEAKHAQDFMAFYEQSGIESTVARQQELESQVMRGKSLIAKIVGMKNTEREYLEKLAYYNGAIANLQQMLDDIKVCPLCGSPMEAHTHAEETN